MKVQKVLDHYGYDTQGANGSIKILCPFHHEDTPSLNVDLNTGLMFCFGCGWRGDIIGFVAGIEGVNRLFAIRHMFRIDSNLVSKRKFSFSSVLESSDETCLDIAYERYKDTLKPDWQIPNYFSNRGFSPWVLDEFDVRMDPLSDYPFLIPLFENGNFKGYVRRAADNRSNKYLYNRGFSRKSSLIGSFQENANCVFVTEGVLDYIKAYQFGIRKNVVCLLGWKASQYQLDVLRATTNVIVSALDNDKVGREGAEFLKKHFDNVVNFPYPEGYKDVGEMDEEVFESCKNNLGGVLCER